MTKREILCYLAGAIDSDGTIGIKRSTYAMRRRGPTTQPVFSERVALRQVTPEIVDLLHKTFGGSVYITKPSVARGRPLWSWNATDLQAANCLRALLPFLRVKAEQAHNALSLRVVKEQSKLAKVAVGRGHVGAAVRPIALTEAMQRHYERAKELNAVGIAVM